MATRYSRLVATALLFLAFGVSQALAQNYEGPGVLRFGIYGQGLFLDSDVTRSNGTNVGTSLDTAGFGASFGYDWRMDRLMIGIEADVTTVNDSYRVPTGSVAVDYMSTVRGRLGWFASPQVLIYGTGGLGVLHSAYEPTGSRRDADTVTGWVAGAGAEYDFYGMSIFAEYLHADFGRDSLRAQGVADLPVDSQADVARLGVKFKIGFDY